MITKLVWGHVQRPWGYEVRVDYEDAFGIYHEVMTFPSQPLQAEIDAKVEVLRAARESREAMQRADEEFERLIS